MDLLIKANDGTCFIVTEELEKYDLDKHLAASQIILDIKNEMDRINARPNYERVDITPGLKLPGAQAAYNVALSRRQYWLNQCVGLLDEASLHNCCPDGAAESVSKASYWQDKIIRIMAGTGIESFKVLDETIVVKWKDSEKVDRWGD